MMLTNEQKAHVKQIWESLEPNYHLECFYDSHFMWTNNNEPDALGYPIYLIKAPYDEHNHPMSQNPIIGGAHSIEDCKTMVAEINGYCEFLIAELKRTYKE